jgi:hypothetical protein
MVITNNQQNIVINFHLDFTANMQSNSFQGQKDMDYSIGLTIPGKLGCPNKKDKKTNPMFVER